MSNVCDGRDRACAQLHEVADINTGVERAGERSLAVAEHLAQRQSRLGRNAAARQRGGQARQVGQARVEGVARAHSARPRSATQSGFRSRRR